MSEDTDSFPLLRPESLLLLPTDLLESAQRATERLVQEIEAGPEPQVRHSTIQTRWQRVLIFLHLAAEIG